MDFFELLGYRKSTRKFTDEQISPDDLAKILYAANAAPVGSNMYKDVHLTVVRDRDALDKLAQAAIKRFEDREVLKAIAGDIQNERVLRKVVDPFYAAPVVIFISHRKQDLQPGIEFANVACIALSMHLAATELGLGSVFMWGSLESMRVIPELDHTPALGLPEGFEPLLGLAIGHTKTALLSRDIKPDKITLNYV
jgi:nitroreductase